MLFSLVLSGIAYFKENRSIPRVFAWKVVLNRVRRCHLFANGLFSTHIDHFFPFRLSITASVMCGIRRRISSSESLPWLLKVWAKVGGELYHKCPSSLPH